MSATIMMATTVESHTPLLKGSRKERRLGGAFIVMMMIVIVIYYSQDSDNDGDIDRPPSAA